MKKKTKYRKSRISYCEWYSASCWLYNRGGIICSNCNFSRTLSTKEQSHYCIDENNKSSHNSNCPNCHHNDWYWLPPIARVPRKGSKKWRQFWIDLKKRRFNHPEGGCR